MSDYKQRMIREHRELQERISKLAHMLEGYAEGTLDFTPACSFQLLESQLYAMGAYANILQERARIEQVDLNAPLEGGCSRKPAPYELQYNIAAWNRICNGDKCFALTYKSLGGRR